MSQENLEKVRAYLATWDGEMLRPEERPFQRITSMGRITLPEGEVFETELLRPLVAGGDEIAGDVDAEHVGSQQGRWHRCRPVAAPDVEDPHPGRDAKIPDECLAALAHALRDAGEVALLPQRLIRVHRIRAHWLLL